MKKYSTIFSILLLSLLFISACSKNGAMEKITVKGPNQPGNIPGMGDANNNLEGKEFFFGPEITITGGIQGDHPDHPMTDYCAKTGSGSYVLLQFSFVNQSGKDTVFVLPAGLTFNSANENYQNGMLIKSISISMKKGESCKTLIYAYCINENKKSSDRSNTYTFGPVNHAAPILEIINLLKNKSINYDSLQDNEQKDKVNKGLQTAIWHITDGDGLTKEDREFIKSL